MRDLVTKTGKRGRALNPKAALIVAIVVAATCFGLRKLHDKQFSATLTFLRNAAFAELEKKDYRAAQKQLTQYLAFRNSDQEARERLSWVLSEQIQTRPALEEAHRHNEDLLRKGFGDDALRLRQARVASKLGELSDAEAHLKLLRKSQTENSEVWFLSGRCAEAARDLTTAVDFYKRAIRCSKPLPDAFTALATLANDQTPAEFNAETMLAEMVRRCPSAQAWFMRASYHFDHGQYRSAIDDAWKAIDLLANSSSEELDAATAPVHLARLNAILANSLQQIGAESAKTVEVQKHLNRAVEHFSSLVNATPSDPSPRLYLTAVFQKLGKRNDAIRTLEDGIQKNPRAFLLHTTLIDLLIDSGDVARADRLLESIPQGGLPREAMAYCRGRLLMAEKKWKDAITSFEETIGFSSRGSSLFSRAQLSLALCRTHTSDASTAVESFRTVVAENPDSVAARLGMAAAWVKAGQTDLAIAEYRGLVNVPGVAPYLADLLIQRTATQPASLRNWSEVDQLLREDQPAIADPIQRILLRADRLFAAGDLLAAINTLENAHSRHRDQSQISAALARMHGKFGDGLRQRLEVMIAEQPRNSEAYAALVREQLVAATAESDSSARLAAAHEMLDAMVNGSHSAIKDLPEQDRLQLTIETIAIIVGLEHRLGRDTYTSSLEEAAVRLSRTLAEKNSGFEKQLVASLARSGRVAEALAFLKDSKPPEHPHFRGDAIVELVRSSSVRSSVLPKATTLMYELIRQHPQSIPLRVNYADLLLYSSQYELAEQTLKPLAEIPGSKAEIAIRRAWLRAAQLKDLDEALKISSVAIRASNGDVAAREARARVFLAKRQFSDALRELESAGFERLSLAGQIYRITALLNLDREPEATVALETIHMSDSDRLFPADRDLLVALTERIRMPATEDSQDTTKPTRTAVSGEKQL